MRSGWGGGDSEWTGWGWGGGGYGVDGAGLGGTQSGRGGAGGTRSGRGGARKEAEKAESWDACISSLGDHNISDNAINQHTFEQ